MPAPPSGQLIRLRQGRSPSQGYVQIYSNNKWGWVCDSGSWSMEEADLVCKQLGFSRGVKKATQGLVHGPVEQEDRATERVDCEGGESELEECPHKDKDEGELECKLEQDIVSVSCQYDSLAGCSAKEMPFGNSCYSFHASAKSFDEAQDICKKHNKTLVEIESQEENDMISELLFQSSLTSMTMDQVWTGGIGALVKRSNVWFWHSETDKIMEFRNFWKGWTGGDRLDRTNLQYDQVKYILFFKLDNLKPFASLALRKKRIEKHQSNHVKTCLWP